MKVIYTLLWMLAAFLVGYMLLFVVITVIGIVHDVQGDAFSIPNNRLINLAIIYALPVVALFLGIKGILPGTQSDKPIVHRANTTQRMPTPIFQASAQRSIPPVISQPQIGGGPLSLEQVASMLENVFEQKFEQDRPLLSHELFSSLLFCVVNKKTFKLIAAHSGRPTEQDIAAFEQTIGFSLPRDYRAFVMTGFGSLFVEANETIWPRPKEGAIVPAWYLKHSLYVYGLSTDVPDFMDIRKQFAMFSKGGRRFVPFLRLEGSLDHYCFSPEGGILLWRSDTRDTQPVEHTFTALLLKELTTLQERAQKIQNEPNPYA